MSNNMRCPYCNHNVTIIGNNFHKDWRHLNVVENKKGDLIGLESVTMVCPNDKCNELILDVFLTRAMKYNTQERNVQYLKDKNIKQWKLLPESSAKPLKTYVPKAIREDYEEACKIKNLSPKASATLSRRCLQGIIRDFWGIVKKSLKAEIGELKNKVDSDLWEAIDEVRNIGNIGAHMEKDINLIIDIDPNEAQLLIELIEIIIEEWYVDRHEKQKRLKKLKAVGAQKEVAKKNKNTTKKKKK